MRKQSFKIIFILSAIFALLGFILSNGMLSVIGGIGAIAIAIFGVDMQS